DRDQLLNNVRMGVEKVGQVWNNFVEIYNLESGSNTLQRENTDVVELVERVINSAPFKRAKSQIRIEAAKALPILTIDPLRIERALTNVIQRAVNVSPSPVTVYLNFRDNAVLISVRDEGVLLSPDQLDHLFDPVNPSSTFDTVDYGLYITRELVTRHGGRTW